MSIDNTELQYVWVIGTENRNRIFEFLQDVDGSFTPTISERVDIEQYADKLSEKADTIFALYGDVDIASASIYCNTETAYISSIAVKKVYMGRKVGTKLLEQIKEYAKEKKCISLVLDVYGNNQILVDFYLKNGFSESGDNGAWKTMICRLE